jgi:hypothetical protein
LSLRNRFKYIFAILLNLGCSLIPASSASAIGSGVCVSTVNSSTGVVSANSGGYCYVAFTAVGSNSWTAPSGITAADFLIIAGGGAGGAGAWGGGGGAGEVVYYTNYSVSSSSATSLSVGGGGSSGTASLDPTLNASNNGTHSWIGSSSGVVAQGGGAGASYGYSSAQSYTTGKTGGSGGGGSENNPASPGGTANASSSGSRSGYGNAGGYGSTSVSGGGGGGSGAAGTNASASTGGNGGNGTNLFSTWLSAINSGMSGITGWQTATSTGYIAAGGGGGASTTGGTAGSGGGGAGISSSVATANAGVTNTGSGGGGTGYYGSTARTAGAGGSGLIIIKYSVLTPSANSFNLTGNVTTATYRSAITININVNTAAKITFRAKGVVITGCKNKLATGSGSSYSATCSWKPSMRGQVNLTADISPTGPWASASTSPLSIRVASRSDARI